VPIPPPKPFYMSSTDTTITIGLLGTLDNGGSRITKYKIFRDAGNLTSPVNIEQTTYDGFSATFTATGLSPGINYRFRYFATNKFGDSAASLTLTIASSSLPQPPTDIVIDWSKSSKT